MTEGNGIAGMRATETKNATGTFLSEHSKSEQWRRKAVTENSPHTNTYSYPTGSTVHFPYETPYEQQVALMDALLEGIRYDGDRNASKTKVLCLESPTGTGKSLSLACASLSWLEYMQSVEDEQLQQELQDPQPDSPPKQTTESAIQHSDPPLVTPLKPLNEASDTGRSWLDDWKPPDDDTLEKEQRKSTLRDQQDRKQQLSQRLQDLRQQVLGDPSSSKSDQQARRENLIQQAIAKEKMHAKKEHKRKMREKRQRTQILTPVNRSVPLAYEEEDDEENSKPAYSRRNRPTIKGSAAWMLEDLTKTLSPSTNPGSIKQSLVPNRPRQIIYAARTHTQLAQFISEVRKTHWGATTRVVALGSRSQGLCGYLSSINQGANKKSETAWTDQCLDLRRSKSKQPSGKRSKASPSSSSCGCPYYQPSSIATLALHSLVVPTDLEDMSSMGSASQTCAYYAGRQALPHAQLVVLPYSLLVDPKARSSIGLDLTGSLVLVDEAHNLPSAISQLTSCKVTGPVCKGALAQIQAYTIKYMERLSPRHLQFLGQLKTLLKGFLKSVQCRGLEADVETTKQDVQDKHGKRLVSIMEFLVDYRLDSINLFPLLRYLQETQLANTTLLGFMDLTIDTGISAHISPMSIVQRFLETLNYQSEHAKLVIQPNSAQDATATSSPGYLELVVLNPAVHAQDDLYRLPHALCLVGGTLQPLTVLMQELVPSLAADAQKAQRHFQDQTRKPQPLVPSQTSSKPNSTALYKSESFVGFTCGHVVSSDHVLLQAVTNVDGVTMDLRFGKRSTPERCNAIGKAVLELARRVPNGLVVFFPSYKYEQTLVEAWKGTGLWARLESTKPIFREPKQSHQMEATLEAYSAAASNSAKGALLLSVIGGKLSEGINFANELCRCVVVIGVPYADRSDPILQEKLNCMVGGPSAQHEYYQSLCLRAVNQSVGRAIRHAKDYACVVMMDARYPVQDGLAQGLPRWLTNSTPNWRNQSGRLQDVTHRVESFFSQR